MSTALLLPREAPCLQPSPWGTATQPPRGLVGHVPSLKHNKHTHTLPHSASKEKGVSASCGNRSGMCGPLLSPCLNHVWCQQQHRSFPWASNKRGPPQGSPPRAARQEVPQSPKFSARPQRTLRVCSQHPDPSETASSTSRASFCLNCFQKQERSHRWLRQHGLAACEETPALCHSIWP